jgi:hypothetical protein
MRRARNRRQTQHRLWKAAARCGGRFTAPMLLPVSSTYRTAQKSVTVTKKRPGPMREWK